MSPEDIVEAAAALGVVLYLDGGALKYSGRLPADWIAQAAPWLAQRAAVVTWLAEAPSHRHRIRMVKVAVANVKRRMKLPCIQLGKLLEQKPSCGCGPRHECGLHGDCVLTGASNRWRVCSRCDDYSPAE